MGEFSDHAVNHDWPIVVFETLQDCFDTQINILIILPILFPMQIQMEQRFVPIQLDELMKALMKPRVSELAPSQVVWIESLFKDRVFRFAEPLLVPHDE